MYLTEKFYQFMEGHKLAVISTVNAAGKPEAAVIGFGQTPKLEIIFGTDILTRKYKNLTHDSHVAFAIGWANSETLQYEGTARELNPDELDMVKDYYWKKSPAAERYHKNPGERYFIVTPTWIRFSDLEEEPCKIQEITEI